MDNKSRLWVQLLNEACFYIRFCKRISLHQRKRKLWNSVRESNGLYFRKCWRDFMSRTACVICLPLLVLQYGGVPVCVYGAFLIVGFIFYHGNFPKHVSFLEHYKPIFASGREGPFLWSLSARTRTIMLVRWREYYAVFSSVEIQTSLTIQFWHPHYNWKYIWKRRENYTWYFKRFTSVFWSSAVLQSQFESH
jgi:hypothetical protein